MSDSNTVANEASNSSLQAAADCSLTRAYDERASTVVPSSSEQQTRLEAALHSILRENGSIPHVKATNFPAQDCIGIDLSTTGAPGRVISHERLRRGLVHAAAVRELFLWRARAELSAVPRNLRHDLSEENQALEEFAWYPRDARTPAEHIYADYLAIEGHLRTETGAMNHARVPRKASPTHPSPPISVPATSSVSPKHSGRMPSDITPPIKLEAPLQQSPRVASGAPDTGHVQQAGAHLLVQTSRPAGTPPSGPVGSFRMPEPGPQESALPESLQKAAGTSSTGLVAPQGTAADRATAYCQPAGSGLLAAQPAAAPEPEPNLQLMMTLAQAVSKSNPQLASMLLTAQQQQQQQQFTSAAAGQQALHVPSLQSPAHFLLQQLQAQAGMPQAAVLPQNMQAAASQSHTPPIGPTKTTDTSSIANQQPSSVLAHEQRMRSSVPAQSNHPSQDEKMSLANILVQASTAAQRGMNPRVAVISPGDSSAGLVQGRLPPPQPLSPKGTESESLDDYLEDPSLLLRIAQRVPKIVSKELPNPGESSDAGVSDIWVQLRRRDAEGKLGGISSHQGSTTSFTISIPHFNTTLSRVNRLEIAAVVEVLLSLRCCRPRNVDSACSRNLRLDLVHFVKHMSIADKDSNASAAYAMRAPTSGLIYPDMATLYKVVLTRIHRWADQIARRVEKDSTIVRRGPKRRRTHPGTEPGRGVPVGVGKRPRQQNPHNMQTRGIMLPVLEGEEDEEEDPDDHEDRSAEDGDDTLDIESDQAPASAPTTNPYTYAGDLHRDPAGTAAAVPGGALAGEGGVQRPRTLHTATATGDAGTGTERGGRLYKGGSSSRGGIKGAEARGVAAQTSWAEQETLPQFEVVAHIFKSPREQLVDFQALLGLLRRVVQISSTACGLSNTYSSVFPRFCRKFSNCLSLQHEVLQCVALYNILQDCSATRQHYALLQAIDLFLEE